MVNIKDSFYFPHDYHARHDKKLEKLRFNMGYEGIGIYWCLVEIMYEEGGRLRIEEIPFYAEALRINEKKVKKIIFELKIFHFDDHFFWSESQVKRQKKINANRRKARSSAKKRWNAFALRSHCDGNARKERKERKESKEIKGGWFKDLWGKYPNKDGKKAAEKSFFSSVNTEEDYKQICLALDNYLKSEKVTKGFIKNGSTWFNNWRDWVDYKPPAQRLV